MKEWRQGNCCKVGLLQIRRLQVRLLAGAMKTIFAQLIFTIVLKVFSCFLVAAKNIVQGFLWGYTKCKKQ